MENYNNKNAVPYLKLFYIDEENINKNNSYYLAIDFNKRVIKGLTEKSMLTQGFLQLNGYILKNYHLENNDEGYSLTNEPIILMKHHMLRNYENIILIMYENSIKVVKDETKGTKNTNLYCRKASYDKKNKMTMINEKILFNIKDSEKLVGEDNALPISIELFHEIGSHSKKNSKNLYVDSPIFGYKNNMIRKLQEAKDGKFIESLIVDYNFILNLK